MANHSQKIVRIGAGAGYSGDRIAPAVELAEKGQLDYLVFECLAERTIALAQLERSKNSALGFDPLLQERMRAVLPLCVAQHIKIITNMGAANPQAAAQAVMAVARELGLSQLKVAAHWEAPLSRNAYEYAWFEELGAEFAEHMPRMLGRDEEAGVFFMSFLEPAQHPVWKQLLLQGQISPAFARSVGDCLGRMHRHTAQQDRLARRFKTDAEFFSLRLEPYLLATAQRHPALADRLHRLCAQTAQTQLALVHGDISPKNILVGRDGPVILDAECAWYGDPAFDAAFCLCHLLAKCLWQPAHRAHYLAAWDAFCNAYLDGVCWEPRDAIASRIALLLAAILLARVDGKSPLEYLGEAERALQRHFARRWLLAGDRTLAAFLRMPKPLYRRVFGTEWYRQARPRI